MSRAKIASIRAQISALEAKITPELQAAADAEVDTSSVVEGSTVTASYGRGDKARVVTGVVTGVKREAGKAALFKVVVGKGFDAEVVTLFESQVTGVEQENAAVGYAE